MARDQPLSRLDDRTAEAFFLDVHVKGVEEDFTIGTFNSLREGNAFLGSVHHELLKAIYNLNAENDAAIFRGLDRFTYAFDRAISKNLFVFTRVQFPRPGTVIDAGHHRPIQIL